MAKVTSMDSASVLQKEVENKNIGLINLHDLNGEVFWKAWASVGGSVDEYIKESLPNYGLVGALLITVSIPATLSPPAFSFSGDTTVANTAPFVELFVILMNVSTASSMAMIVISAAVYQQFVNAYSKSLRIGFAAKFGYMINILTCLLVVDITCLFGALFIVIGSTYGLISAVISIGIVSLSLLITLLLYYRTTSWNSNRYIAQMKIDLQALQDSKAKSDGKLVEDNNTVDLTSTDEKLAAAAENLTRAMEEFTRVMKENAKSK